MRPSILPLCIAGMNINPESRKRVQPGRARPALYEAETKRYPIKIANEVDATPRLKAEDTGEMEEQMSHHEQPIRMSSGTTAPSVDFLSTGDTWPVAV